MPCKHFPFLGGSIRLYVPSLKNSSVIP